MKTFEERYTAWIDGKLDGAELEAFEKELEEHPDALADREDLLKLGSLLRTYGHAPELSNAEFFNHQILTQIREEEKAEAPKETVPTPIFAWLLRPFVWATAAMLIIAGVSVYRVVSPQQQVKSGLDRYVDLSPTPEPEPEKPYNVQIVSAESTDPDISVTPIHSEKDNVTVLWVDGLDYLPASYHGE